jgi:hypothetical protein
MASKTTQQTILKDKQGSKLLLTNETKAQGIEIGTQGIMAWILRQKGGETAGATRLPNICPTGNSNSPKPLICLSDITGRSFPLSGKAADECFRSSASVKVS